MAAQARVAGCPEEGRCGSMIVPHEWRSVKPLRLFESRVGAPDSVTRLKIDEVARSIAALDAPDVLGDEIGLSLPIPRRGP
jgi:hypothetical protein